MGNIGLDVRIFDFDRSVKKKNKFRYYPDALKSIYLRDYYQYNQNATPNHDMDTYKILSHIYFKQTLPEALKSRIKSYFTKPDVLLRGQYYDINKKKYIVVDPEPRYYILAKKLPNNFMKPTLEILEDLATNLDKRNGTQRVLETYSTLNIESSVKERLVKTLKERQLVRNLKTQTHKLTPIKPTKTVKVTLKRSQSNKTQSNKKLSKQTILNNGSNTKCNDTTTKRSKRKTSVLVNGKRKYGKMIDTEEKNCIFPFNYTESQGKGKRKLVKVSDNSCIQDRFGTWCATERNPDCMPKKIGYCV